MNQITQAWLVCVKSGFTCVSHCRWETKACVGHVGRLSKNSSRWSCFTSRPAEKRCGHFNNISKVMQQAAFLGCFNADCHRAQGREKKGTFGINKCINTHCYLSDVWSLLHFSFPCCCVHEHRWNPCRDRLDHSIKCTTPKCTSSASNWLMQQCIMIHFHHLWCTPEMSGLCFFQVVHNFSKVPRPQSIEQHSRVWASETLCDPSKHSAYHHSHLLKSFQNRSIRRNKLSCTSVNIMNRKEKTCHTEQMLLSIHPSNLDWMNCVHSFPSCHRT